MNNSNNEKPVESASTANSSWTPIICKGAGSAGFFLGVPIPPGITENLCNLTAEALAKSYDYVRPTK